MLECTPCAATVGTTVLAEDMFYTMPARQRAVSANGSEYARMLYLVGQYAVFHSNIGFSIRRRGRPPDLQTNAGASQLDAARCVTVPPNAIVILLPIVWLLPCAWILNS